ncbi:hypothetical protein BDY19DRAFT_997408 [Irpex rosettiformis]|uniref:Uncharacterized protein n=1 Tax=Irpex rosettiformis TaxID=378272 RepID=A0ACB8TS24_9APHY|nr:hypothetical protein BDY19DRAFT_997408 [Irpex rosettiformis]
MTVAPLVQLKVTSAVCSFFAILITAFRLYLRRAKFWWDDACAFLSSIFLVVQVVAVFLHLPDPHALSRTGNIAVYYVMAISFYLIIWNARLSILYSIIRIDPNPHMRTILNRVAIVFIFVMLLMCAQLFWVCEPMTTWKNAKSPQCPLTQQVAILQLVTDILADMLLIITPLRLLKQLSAQDGTRKRLMIIFSTSIVTTIVSLVHAAFILTIGGIRVVIAAIIEDTFSLIVCNIPVVVTFLLRHTFVFGPESGSPPDTQGDPGVSTFNWRREESTASSTTSAGLDRSGITVVRTVESDTAGDVTTVNLWELSLTKVGEGRGARVTDGKNGLAVPERIGYNAGAQSSCSDDDGLGRKGERSIVYLAAEAYSNKDCKVQNDGDSEDERYRE